MGRPKKAESEKEKPKNLEKAGDATPTTADQAEVKKEIDFSKLKDSLILIVDPTPDCIKDSTLKQHIGLVDIRESFYKNYLPSRMLIPKYPFKVSDGFVHRIISTCVAVLSPEYKFNRHRVAASKFAGITLKKEGDFYDLIDRILKLYLKEFFTFSLKFPEGQPWVVSGIRHQFEVQYLKMKFRDRPVVCAGVKGDCPGWVDKQIKKESDFLEALCA